MIYLAFPYCTSMSRVNRTPPLVDIRGAALDLDLKEKQAVHPVSRWSLSAHTDVQVPSFRCVIWLRSEKHCLNCESVWAEP